MPTSIEASQPPVLLPSRMTVGGAQGNPTLGKQEFLQLLVAQLKHQDPMNPSNPEDMAAQLAQFSSVEQLIGINEQLGTQASSAEVMASSLNNSTAVGVIGKNVLTPGDQVAIDDPDGGAVTVVVGEGGGRGVLTLFDEGGNRVGARDLGTLDGGRQDIDLGSAADGLPPGDYRYEVSVQDADQSSVEVRTLMRAHIDGVRYGSNGPQLLSGDLEIPMADVIEIIQQ